MVKFIKFERGHYKHLCVGSLTLEIDGKIVRFGDDIDDHYDRFWISGGDTYTDDRGNVFVYKGPWHTKDELLPEEYRQYKDEILKVINDNMRWGCCGACANRYIRKTKK